MEPNEIERKAMDLLWETRSLGERSPTLEEDEALLTEIRQNAKKLEDDVIVWLNRKMARPPRSGLWSNSAPWVVGWIFLMIPVAVLIIWGVITLFGGFK